MTTESSHQRAQHPVFAGVPFSGLREFLCDRRLQRWIGIGLLGAATVAFFVPALGVLLAIAGFVVVTGLVIGRAAVERSGAAASGRRHPAGGIFFVGRNVASGSEVWLTADECRSGLLVSGSPVARSDALLGLAENVFGLDNGMIYVSGGGDVATFAKIYALAKKYGREDDVLVLNLMTSNSSSSNENRILSNTLNPFATGPADSLTEMVISLMDEVHGGDGAMWKGRAIALLTGVMGALVWKRDQGTIDLNIGIIRDYMNLSKIIELADKEMEPLMPLKLRASLNAYLSSLPGFVREKGAKQSQTTLDQHGYLQMQFTRVLGCLADVYGHIFLSNRSQVNITDVVLNRRILVVMLPVLSKSSEEVVGLGKLIVSIIRIATGATVGSRIEDDRIAATQLRPAPFTVIFDDFEQYVVPGMSGLSRSGRALNINFIFGCDDVELMMSNDSREAKAVLGSCAFRIDFVGGETDTAVLMHDGTLQFLTVSSPSFRSVDARVNHMI